MCFLLHDFDSIMPTSEGSTAAAGVGDATCNNPEYNGCRLRLVWQLSCQQRLALAVA